MGWHVARREGEKCKRNFNGKIRRKGTTWQA